MTKKKVIRKKLIDFILIRFQSSGTRRRVNYHALQKHAASIFEAVRYDYTNL